METKTSKIAITLETEYLSSSEQMVEIIKKGMNDAECGNYKIVNVDEL